METFRRSVGLAIPTIAILIVYLPVQIGAQHLNFKHYGPVEGLQQGQIISIYQDHRGFLWFGSYSGVSRYNGHRFETLDTSNGLRDNSVPDISGDKDGNLYFATLGGGLSVFDGRDFQHYFSGNGLLNDSVNDLLVEGDGRIWVATDGGLTCLYQGNSTHYTTENGIDANYCLRVYRADTANSGWALNEGSTCSGTGHSLSRILD